MVFAFCSFHHLLFCVDSLLCNSICTDASRLLYVGFLGTYLKHFVIFNHVSACLLLKKNPWHRPRLMETEAEVAGRSTFGSPRKVPTKFPHTIPKMDTLPRSRPGKLRAAVWW